MTGSYWTLRRYTRLLIPHDRYIAPHMKLDAFKKRLVDWVETDWKSKALKLGPEWREHAVELHREKGEKLDIVSQSV